MNKCLFLSRSLRRSLLSCISFWIAVNPFKKCPFWWCWLFLVSGEQLQLPCQTKDQFIAWGPFSYPLKTPISTPVKVGTHQPLNSNEHSPRQDQDNNENSILVDGEIHLYTSNYQLLAQPQTPQYPFRHIFPRQAPSFFLYSLVIKSLLMEGIQFSFQGRPSGPQ